MDLFYKRMESYIPDEMEAFMLSLNRKMYQGLRVNTKKISKEKFIQSFSDIEQITPFCDNGFYISKNLGNHPYHICGLYYLQEPSAMAVVEALDIKEDDVVLDLCAAPGGKSSQIAAKLKNGFLVSNEIDSKRVQILLSNMERMGMVNMAITNTTPEKICTTFPSCFDKIVVDAPCSGEGMMKKHNLARQEWSYENILYCAKRQKDILRQAYKALKKDGILVYSTCTYAKEENEDVIAWFLKEYPDCELVDIHSSYGRSGLKTEGIQESYVRRVFPMDQGEGHFIAKIVKTQGEKRNLPVLKNQKVDKITMTFLKEQLNELYSHYYIMNGNVYAMDREFIDFKKIKLLRQGLFCGTVLKNRFEPSHAFYMNEDISRLKKVVDVSFDLMNAFMHGLSISYPCEKGFTALSYEGYPFGFGKSDGMTIKNKIPKGLRFMEGTYLYGKK
ncbi:RsmF rRNA methyltransferase first C-terminal domain-containing protein [Floccifex sp.]|uniref:RsmF rRNA methyltransferase first C-terminal domain-containing protein n=1 Tax=Floccifex sp. TaxID=2815810 RepID=UPI003F00A7D7